MPKVEDIQAAVADELERRGHSNREFIAEIREGRRDEGPFMIGALAAVERALVAAE